MTQDSWPSTAHPAVSRTEYEQLTHPASGDGIVGTPADTSVVFGDGSTLLVKIRSGKFGLVRGHHWWSGSSDTTEAIASNASGLTRIDLVTLQLDRSDWSVRTNVTPGLPGGGAPALVQNTGTTGVYEVPLATVTVPSGDSAIGSEQVVRAEYFLGEPPTVCTSGTKPGHAYGRRIYETDTGLTYISNGVNSWRLIQPPVFTSSTRPSHQLGLLIWESDTSRLMVSTGAAWRAVSDDSGPSLVSMSGGCTALDNNLARVNGMATLSLSVKRSTQMAAGVASQVGQIPAGFFPRFTVGCQMFYFSGSGQSLRMSIDTGGVVRIHTPQGLVWNADREVEGSTTWPVAT